MSNTMTEAVAESEDRRKEFRQYLVDGGVLEAVVKGVVTLYACEDKPADPVDFFRKVMGDERPTLQEVNLLRVDVKTGLQQVYGAAQENQRLRERLQELEPDSDLLVSSVVTPELLLPPEEEEQESAPTQGYSYESDLQSVKGETFQPGREEPAEPEVQEQSEPAAPAAEAPQAPAAEEPAAAAAATPEVLVLQAEAASMSSENTHADAKSMQSEPVSEKKSVEEAAETPAVATSDGGQAQESEEDAAPLH